jgi:DNA-binding MarR family transcriptional regulator
VAIIVVQYPGPQGERPSDLAARLRISKQALNHLLRQLEHLGYLTRRPDPDDKRSKRIALTPRGTEAAITIREAVAQIENTWTRQLGPARFNQLRTLLRELVELNQSPSGSRSTTATGCEFLPFGGN